MASTTDAFVNWWSKHTNGKTQSIMARSLAERAFRAGWTSRHQFLYRHRHMCFFRYLGRYNEKRPGMVCAMYDVDMNRLVGCMRQIDWNVNYYWKTEVAKNYVRKPTAKQKELTFLAYRAGSEAIIEKFRMEQSGIAYRWLMNRTKAA